jgi:hypothetical protein
VGFVWTSGARAVRIEVKAAATWRGEYGAALKGLIDQRALKAGHGVYTGSAKLKDRPLHIWPIVWLLRALTTGDILG